MEKFSEGQAPLVDRGEAAEAAVSAAASQGQPDAPAGFLDAHVNPPIAPANSLGLAHDHGNAHAHDHEQHSHAERHHHHDHSAHSHHSSGHHLLQVEDLSLSFRMYDPQAQTFFGARQVDVPAVSHMSLSVHAGEIVAVVGASGSGKTLLADSIMGLFEPNATACGSVWFDGQLQTAESMSKLRGNGLSLVPQSVNYLDPLMKVGRQVRGQAAKRLGKAQAIARQRYLFQHYGLLRDVEGLYPFELSGGMARRVLLCCALMDDPKVIIADEPTPGLDLPLAVRALQDFRTFADAGGGVMLITHDIELALNVADRVAVFKDGTVVEETAVENFRSPDRLQHPFSQQLCRAVGMESLHAGQEAKPYGEGGQPVPSLLEARDVAFTHLGASAALYEGFNFKVEQGQRVALSAPSGYGKTTLCRLLAGYVQPQAGQLLLDGAPLPQRGISPVQLVSQHPERAIDPRQRMQATLAEAGPLDWQLLERLGIQQRWFSRYPHELSGGELQRFCIARALMARPKFLIADEVSTMFDAITQQQIWHVLLDQVQQHNMGLVFVSHSPALVQRVATHVVDLESVITQA